MYTLIIVDDDEIVRNGLKRFIDWKAMGFHLIECLEDGVDAIDFLNKQKVDVVLTDIDMIHTSGLTLAKHIYEHSPHTRTVIVSGHKNFEYAKKAIEYNVRHYLTKPTDVSDIKKVFNKLKKELDEQYMKIVQEEKYKRIIPFLQEQFVYNLFNGMIGDLDTFHYRFDTLGLPTQILNNPCFVIEIQIDELESSNYGQLLFIKERLQEMFQIEKEGINYLSFYSTEHVLKVLVLSVFDDEKYVMDNFHQEIQIVQGIFQQNFDLTLGISNAKKFKNITDLINDIQLSQSQMTKKLVTLELSEYREFTKKYQMLTTFIIQGDKSSIIEQIENVFQTFDTLTLPDVQWLMVDLYSFITHQLFEKGMNIFRLNDSQFTYYHILQMESKNEIKQWCIHVFTNYAEWSLEKQSESSTNILIEKVKDFIHSSYMEDLSLDIVADQVYLNPVYLSRLFKEKTGQNFSDYLTNVRMEQAIQLLKENKYLTYEISEMVGYRSSKYFSRVFKQEKGYSPREYARRYLLESSHGL